MIGRYCGGANNKPPRLIESAGPELHVVFHSDVSATFEGFYAEYASSTTGFPTRAPQAVDELGEPVENYISGGFIIFQQLPNTFSTGVKRG